MDGMRWTAKYVWIRRVLREERRGGRKPISQLTIRYMPSPTQPALSSTMPNCRDPYLYLDTLRSMMSRRSRSCFMPLKYVYPPRDTSAVEPVPKRKSISRRARHESSIDLSDQEGEREEGGFPRWDVFWIRYRFGFGFAVGVYLPRTRHDRQSSSSPEYGVVISRSFLRELNSRSIIAIVLPRGGSSVGANVLWVLI